MHPAFWPYLIGLFPIFLARTWRARIVALMFGGISIACGIYQVWSIHSSPDVAGEVQGVALSQIVGLSIAIISAVATYLVDKKKGPKI